MAKTIRPKISSSRTRNRNKAAALDVSVAMLEQQVEQTSHRFEVLGEKFDRILSRVEELALHTTSLNSRHDTEIQVLQKQLASTEVLVTQTRDDISAMTTKLTEFVGKELSEAFGEMSDAIDHLTEKMDKQNTQLDTRVQNLERWRMLLIGGGLAIGVILSRLSDVLLTGFFPTK